MGHPSCSRPPRRPAGPARRLVAIALGFPLGFPLGFALAATLGGCAAERVVTGTWSSDTTIYGHTAYAVQGRDVAVTAFGDPFGVGEARMAEIAAAALHAPGAAARFTTAPGPSARPQYRVAAHFGISETFRIVDLCAGPDPEADPSTGPRAGPGLDPGPQELRIAVAFCFGQAVQSAVWGWVDDPAGAGDPAIAGFLGEVGHDLFPPPPLLPAGRLAGGAPW